LRYVLRQTGNLALAFLGAVGNAIGMFLMMPHHYFLSMAGKLIVEAAIAFMAGSDLAYIRRLAVLRGR